MTASLQDWSNIAVIIAGVSATIVLLVHITQVQLSRRFQKESVAKTTYREYLRLSIDYPFFGDGTPSGLDELETSRYEWFVSFFLLAAEEVLEYAGHDDRWVNAVKEEIGRHKEYLRGQYCQTVELSFYSKKLQNTVQEIVLGS